MKAIIDERMKDGKIEYRVRWKGYTAKDDTWEDYENIKDTADQALEDFKRGKAKKRGKTKKKKKAVVSFFI